VNLKLASATECITRLCVSKIPADPHFFIRFTERQQSNPRNLAGVFEPSAKVKGAFKKRVKQSAGVWDQSLWRHDDTSGERGQAQPATPRSGDPFQLISSPAFTTSSALPPSCSKHIL